MGMFDYLRCEYPLPAPDAQHLEFQTKDTDNQYLDEYVIRADGTLWVQEYDTEDCSDPKAEGLMKLIGCATRVREHWVNVPDVTGEIRFYSGCGPDMWVEFSAYFLKGKLQQLNLINDTRPAPADNQNGRTE